MTCSLSYLSINELGQRSNQEDSIYPPLNEKVNNNGLFILCDGMGGHAAGEVASSTVCEAMSRYIAAHPREDGLFEESDFNAALEAAYSALDKKDTEDEKKMGTTLTFVKFHKGGCFVAHIGDSRIYQVRPSEKRILHVTKDHSLVNDLISLGELTPEQAKTSPQKNVITRAMQPHQERRVKADCVNLTDVRPGDYFYMCSDGMLEQMEDHELVNILSMDQPDSRKIEILLGATKENHDNHSAHLIKVLSLSHEQEETKQEEDPKPQKRPWWKLFSIALLFCIFGAMTAVAQSKMNTCRVQIYFDDDTVLCEEKIHVYWTKGGLFSSEYEGTFTTDKKGWVTISWPADEADEIKDIYFSTGFIFSTRYEMTNLSLQDGKTYRLNADSFKDE